MSKRMFRILMSPEPGNQGGGGGGGGGTLLSQGANGGGSNGQPAGANGGGAPGGGGPQGGALEPFWNGWIGSDGKLQKSRYDHLPDDLKPFRATLENFEDLPSFLRTAMHDRSLVGKKGLLPLPAHATDKDRQDFRQRLNEVLGVPEKPDGYGIKRPDTIPEEAWDGDLINAVSAVAHEHSVSPQALAKLVETYNGHQLQAANKAEQARISAEKAEIDALRKELGGGFDQAVKDAARVARALDLDLDDPTIGNNPAIIKALSKVKGMIGEHNLITGESPGSGPSPEEQIQSIMYNAQDPLYAAYRDENHPQHGLAVDRVGTLTKLEVEMKRAKGQR